MLKVIFFLEYQDTMRIVCIFSRKIHQIYRVFVFMNLKVNANNFLHDWNIFILLFATSSVKFAILSGIKTLFYLLFQRRNRHFSNPCHFPLTNMTYRKILNETAWFNTMHHSFCDYSKSNCYSYLIFSGIHINTLSIDNLEFQQ